MYRRYEELLKRHKKKSSDVSKATGIAHSTLSDWKNGKSTPKQDKLQLIADYFNVSVDYLLTGNEDTEKNMNIDERIQELIDDLTGDNSAYCYGKVMSYEGKLALLNSLKQDKEFLMAMQKREGE